MRALTLTFAAASLLATTSAFANHPVLVEGNCLVPPAGTDSANPPGTCGDYDGDGLIGTADDNDGDRVFGTINGALGAGSGTPPTGANQNGNVTIVTSGVFAEVVNITAANGNVTLQAAPGVEAIIDAVLQGDPGSTARQSDSGIIITAPNDRRVIVRNLTVRNFATGIRVMGASRVAIENVRVENNVEVGILVRENARVKIDQSQVIATGFRTNPTTDFPSDNRPRPGIGIVFSGSSSGAVFRTEVSFSFAAGISKRTSGNVRLEDVYLFGNSPDRENFGNGNGNGDGDDDGDDN